MYNTGFAGLFNWFCLVCLLQKATNLHDLPKRLVCPEVKKKIQVLQFIMFEHKQTKWFMNL